MKKLTFLSFLVIFGGSLLLPNSVHAQTESPTDSNIATNSANMKKQTIIVQTDSEEPISDHEIVCKQLPKKLGPVSEDEITYHELTTAEDGSAVLGVTDSNEYIFSCSSKEITTSDYCWYFPSSTTFFDMSAAVTSKDNEAKPIYLVGINSPNSCGKEINTEDESEIAELLPSGTPQPFTNKNVVFAADTDSQTKVITADTTEEPNIGLLQKIVIILKNLVGLN